MSKERRARDAKLIEVEGCGSCPFLHHDSPGHKSCWLDVGICPEWMYGAGLPPDGCPLRSGAARVSLKEG